MHFFMEYKKTSIRSAFEFTNKPNSFMEFIMLSPNTTHDDIGLTPIDINKIEQHKSYKL